MITIILFQPVSQPSLNYKDTGNRIGLLGSFDALSFYSFVNSSQIVNDPDTSVSIFQKKRTFQILHPHQQVFPIVYIFKILPIIIV